MTEEGVQFGDSMARRVHAATVRVEAMPQNDLPGRAHTRRDISQDFPRWYNSHTETAAAYSIVMVDDATGATSDAIEKRLERYILRCTKPTIPQEGEEDNTAARRVYFFNGHRDVEPGKIGVLQNSDIVRALGAGSQRVYGPADNSWSVSAEGTGYRSLGPAPGAGFGFLLMRTNRSEAAVVGKVPVGGIPAKGNADLVIWDLTVPTGMAATTRIIKAWHAGPEDISGVETADGGPFVVAVPYVDDEYIVSTGYCYPEQV